MSIGENATNENAAGGAAGGRALPGGTAAGNTTADRTNSAAGRRVMAVIAVVALLAMALCLVACGGGSGGASGSGGSSRSTVTKFEGTKSADAKELERAAEYGISWGKNVKETTKGKTSDQLKAMESSVADKFAEGNSLYRSGDYDGAELAYKAVLDDHPTHFGANVNVVLALLQKGYDTEALNDAFKCLYLFPDDPGCLLNVQTAATACGYSDLDIETAINNVLEQSNQTTVEEALASGDTTNGLTHFREYYLYNSAWNRIETDMYDVLHSDKGSAGTQPIDIYTSVHSRLEQAESAIPGGDKDVEALLAYVEAVGKQLDLETS